MSEAPYQTMGVAHAQSVTVRGLDLCQDLIGTVDFGSMVYLEIMGSLPAAAAGRILNGVLVALAEHGLTANALAARLTYAGSPESLQGAVAAGLLGVGDVFLGAMEQCSRLLETASQRIADGEPGVIASIVRQYRETGKRLPGIGHSIHKQADPRASRLFALADAEAVPDHFRRLMASLHQEAERAYQRRLPLNVDGACAAILSDLGLPWQTQRGIALVARAAGLVGHVWDEASRPVARMAHQQAAAGVGYHDPETVSKDLL
jgi:citrate synthase